MDQPAAAATNAMIGGVANIHAQAGGGVFDLEFFATTNTAQHHKQVAPIGVTVRTARTSGEIVTPDAASCARPPITRTEVRIAGCARATRREISAMDICNGRSRNAQRPERVGPRHWRQAKNRTFAPRPESGPSEPPFGVESGHRSYSARSK